MDGLVESEINPALFEGKGQINEDDLVDIVNFLKKHRTLAELAEMERKALYGQQERAEQRRRRRGPPKTGPPMPLASDAMKLYKMAKFLYESVEKEKNTEGVDPEEFGWLLQELWRRLRYAPLPADVKIRIIDDVRRCMGRFDVDQDGTISFNEFVRMLLCAPWGNYLPTQARKELPFLLLLKQKREEEDRRLASGEHEEEEESVDFQPGPAHMKALKEIFDKLDTDCSGELEEGEMIELMEQIWFDNEQAGFANRTELVQETKAIIERFDEDKNGSINFNEFIQMMSKQPFLKMLPRAARDHFIMEGRRVASLPADKNQAKRAMIEARNLFKAADLDEDGFLEENELANVMMELHRRMGKKMSADARVRIVETCRQQIRRFDQHNTGCLDFVGFVRMLSGPPWNEVVGKEAAAQIPFLLMRGLKNDVEKPRAEPRPGDELLEFAREIFDKADADDSGFIDEQELGELLKMVWAKLGRPFGKADKERLRYEVHAAMINFDVDQSGTISFPEFIMLLSKKPWRLMLPQELQDDILMRGQEVWAETPPRIEQGYDEEDYEEVDPYQAQATQQVADRGAYEGEGDYMMTEQQFQEQQEASQEMAMMSQPQDAYLRPEPEPSPYQQQDYMQQAPMPQGDPAMMMQMHQMRQQQMAMSQPQRPRGRPGDKYPKELHRKWPASLPRPRVYLMPNDGIDPPIQCSPAMVYSLANLLDMASKQLGMSRAARRLFMKATGEEILYLDQLRNNMELLVSMGEDPRHKPRRPPANRPPSPPKLRGTGPSKTYTGYQPWISAGSIESNTRVSFEARQAQNLRAPTERKIWPAGIKRPRVILKHNDGGHRGTAYPMLVYSLKNLMDEGTKHLGLARCARKIYDMNGNVINDLSELHSMMEVCLSEGEPFRPRVTRGRHRRH